MVNLDEFSTESGHFQKGGMIFVISRVLTHTRYSINRSH